MAWPRGSKNCRWQGGLRVNEDGYLQITAGPLRWVYVHRLVLEAKLGRPLQPGEEAHHIDGDRLNCHPGNLTLVTRAEHLHIPQRHWKLKDLGES